MMKYEFEDRLKALEPMRMGISDEDYSLIEYVYTWHPCISETEGKAQVAWLYKEFGIKVFQDMQATARRNQELEEAIQRTRGQLQKLLDEADALRKGGRP